MSAALKKAILKKDVGAGQEMAVMEKA